MAGCLTTGNSGSSTLSHNLVATEILHKFSQLEDGVIYGCKKNEVAKVKRFRLGTKHSSFNVLCLLLLYNVL